VRGLAILRAFLSRLAHERLQREINDKRIIIYSGENKAQHPTDLCKEGSLNDGYGAVGGGTITASTFSQFVALSKGSGSYLERP